VRAKTSVKQPNGALLAGLKHLLQGLLLFPLLASAADHVATVTLLEGGASLLRGTSRYGLAEGVRLDHGDILELADKGLAQLEFTDGTLIALGPRSRFMVLSYPAGSRGRGAGELFLLAGWLKVERTRPEPPVIARIVTPLLEVAIASTAAVINTSAAEAAIFVETGEAKAAQVARGGQTEEAVRLKNGQFYSCKQDQRCVLTPRPSRTFLDGLPRSFMDTLPSRLAKFKDRAVAPKKGADFTYNEVEGWINSTPPVRRAVARAWRSKAQEPAFRSALAANLREHPEWDRILNPEKYEDTPGSWGAKAVAEPK
jgi:FecR protein